MSNGVQLIRRLAKPGTWWTVEDAAHYLHQSITTVRRAARSGRLAGVFVGGRIWRFRQEDCDKFMAEQRRLFNPKGCGR
jgi:excisionase family DNA binding protein